MTALSRESATALVTPPRYDPGNRQSLESNATATAETGVRASIGFASKTGLRKANEDFAGAVLGAELPQPRQEVIAAIADGIGGAKGGRIAAETAVRGFLDSMAGSIPWVGKTLSSLEWVAL